MPTKDLIQRPGEGGVPICGKLEFFRLYRPQESLGRAGLYRKELNSKCDPLTSRLKSSRLC